MSGRARRIVRRLVIVDVVVLAVVVLVWALGRAGGEDERGNAVNGSLRGSKPPGGQTIPDLSGLAGLEPPVAAPSKLRGRPLMIVGTCVDCRSGQVIGGFLGRLDPGDLPGELRVVLVGWDGDAATWRQEQRIPREFEVHIARDAAARNAVQARLDGITESGRTYLYDRSGRWRSTFHLGQLNREDLLHDLDQLGED